MKITAIQQQVKRQGRYSIFVDERFEFSLGEGALLEQRVYVGREIDSGELAGFKKASHLDKAYNLALAYVARRVRSEWELREYFRRKEFDEDVASYIMERLRGFGYVDDLGFARAWVDNRRALKPVSRRRLMQELHQKHVSDDVVRQVLEDDETTDHDTLAQLVERKRRQTRYQDPAKLTRYLAGQGYNYDDIKRVMAGNSDNGSDL